MTIVYEATSASKHVERDYWKHGCDPDTGRFTMMERISIRASSVNELRKRLCERYALPDVGDDDDGGWAFQPEDDDPSQGRLIYSRIEDAEGSPPSESQRAAWKDGNAEMWLADYSFAIDAHQPVAIPDDEVTAMERL